MEETAIDGVYVDGADPDNSFYRDNFDSPAQVLAFKLAQQRALAKAIVTWRLRAPHKYLGGYAAPRVKREQRPNHCPKGSCAGPAQLFFAGPAVCADTMRLLISRAGWTNQTLFVATRHHPHDPLAIATFSCRPPWWSQNCRVNSTRDPAPEIAAFLIARGPSAIFQVVVQPAHSMDYLVSTLSCRSCLYCTKILLVEYAFESRLDMSADYRTLRFSHRCFYNPGFHSRFTHGKCSRGGSKDAGAISLFRLIAAITVVIFDK
eukprot:SAG31_NODE_3647_length_4030_cov_2.232002_4_plen_262_part_00